MIWQQPEKYKNIHPPDRKSSALEQRHCVRVPGCCKVLLRSCDWNGAVRGEFEEGGMLSDYSPCGLRIVMEKEFPVDSLLLVDFGNDFVAPQLQAITEPCWQRRPVGRICGIEVGLVLRDSFSKMVLAAQLEQ